MSGLTFEDEWVANEGCLVQEAGSLGALLERMRSTFSRLLIGDPQWECLTARTRHLPPTLIGFPLWLGFPLSGSRPTVSLDVSLLGGTRSAAFVAEAALSVDSDPVTGIASSLLEQAGTADSPLRHVVGDRVILHHGIDTSRWTTVESTALLYPVRPTLAAHGPNRRLRDFRIALDAVAVATARKPDPAEHRCLERVYSAMEPGVRIGAIGASPTETDAHRLAVLGFSTTEAALAFLDRAGWRGRTSSAAEMLKRLEACGALAGMQLGVQLDVTATGVQPALELQIFSARTIYDDTGWFKERECWKDLMVGLSEEGLADAEKLPELEKWSFAAKPFFGRSGLLLLLQRIHHFAIAADDGDMGRVHAHVFLLLTRWPRRAAETG